MNIDLEAKTPIDFLDYRGFNLDFYYDEQTQQFYTIWENEVLPFGRVNTEYKNEMKSIIDCKLDTIFKDKFTKLEYFENGGNRDIRLIYNKRILKVYITGISFTDIERIKNDAFLVVKEYLNAKLSSSKELRRKK